MLFHAVVHLVNAQNLQNHGTAVVRVERLLVYVFIDLLLDWLRNQGVDLVHVIFRLVHLHLRNHGEDLGVVDYPVCKEGGVFWHDVLVLVNVYLVSDLLADSQIGLGPEACGVSTNVHLVHGFVPFHLGLCWVKHGKVRDNRIDECLGHLGVFHGDYVDDHLRVLHRTGFLLDTRFDMGTVANLMEGDAPLPCVLSVVKLDELGVGVEQVCANRRREKLDGGKVGGHGCCGCCGCCCGGCWLVFRYFYTYAVRAAVGNCGVRWFNFIKKGWGRCLSPWFFWIFCFVGCESLVRRVSLWALDLSSQTAGAAGCTRRRSRNSGKRGFLWRRRGLVLVMLVSLVNVGICPWAQQGNKVVAVVLGPKVVQEIGLDGPGSVEQKFVVVLVLVAVVNHVAEVVGDVRQRVKAILDVIVEVVILEAAVDKFAEASFLLGKFLHKPRLLQVGLGLVLKGGALGGNRVVAGVDLGLANLNHGVAL